MSRKSQWKSEAQFQAECFKWFDRTYPDQRDRLILQYNNPPNAVQAGMLVSMGMRKGIADHLYFPPLFGMTPVWIEYKILGGRQSPAQIAFMERVRSWGHTYELVIEEAEIFFNLINALQ